MEAQTVLGNHVAQFRCVQDVQQRAQHRSSRPTGCVSLTQLLTLKFQHLKTTFNIVSPQASIPRKEHECEAESRDRFWGGAASEPIPTS